jgi:hypothetical protein
VTLELSLELRDTLFQTTYLVEHLEQDCTHGSGDLDLSCQRTKKN